MTRPAGASASCLGSIGPACPDGWVSVPAFYPSLRIPRSSQIVHAGWAIVSVTVDDKGPRRIHQNLRGSPHGVQALCRRGLVRSQIAHFTRYSRDEAKFFTTGSSPSENLSLVNVSNFAQRLIEEGRHEID